MLSSSPISYLPHHDASHARRKVLPQLNKTISRRHAELKNLDERKLNAQDVKSVRSLDRDTSAHERWLEHKIDLLLEKVEMLELQLGPRSKRLPCLVDNRPSIPTWFEVMDRHKMIRGVSRKGNEYLRTRRHPNELCKVAIDLMVDHNVTASQVPGVLHTTWSAIVPDLTKTYNLGGREVYNNYRRMIPWLVRLQIG